jgi:hypothetical protein
MDTDDLKRRSIFYQLNPTLCAGIVLKVKGFYNSQPFKTRNKVSWQENTHIKYCCLA